MPLILSSKISSHPALSNAFRTVEAPKDMVFSINDDVSDLVLAYQILTDNGATTTDQSIVLGGEAMDQINGNAFSIC